MRFSTYFLCLSKPCTRNCFTLWEQPVCAKSNHFRITFSNFFIAELDSDYLFDSSFHFCSLFHSPLSKISIQKNTFSPWYSFKNNKNNLFSVKVFQANLVLRFSNSRKKCALLYSFTASRCSSKRLLLLWCVLMNGRWNSGQRVLSLLLFLVRCSWSYVRSREEAYASTIPNGELAWVYNKHWLYCYGNVSWSFTRYSCSLFFFLAKIYQYLMHSAHDKKRPID